MLRQFSYHRPCLAGRLAIGNRHVRAVLGSGQSNGAPQSFRSSRDQYRLSRKYMPVRRHPGILRPSACWKACTETATLPRMTQPREVVVYSRKGCHLCEIVKESIVKLQKRGGFTWREIDVDSDAEARRLYNDEVPVVFIDGRKAFKYRMDEQEFLRKLSA